MTRHRGAGPGQSKLAGTTKPPQSKPPAGDPPVPKLPPRGQSFGPGKKPLPAQPIQRENASTNLRIGSTTGGRKRRKHRKTHRKTRRGY